MLRLEVTRLGQARTGQESQVDRNDLSSLLVVGLGWDAAAME